MGKVNSLLSQRLKKGEQSSKMAAMAERSAAGHLTTFAGMFSVSELNATEKSFLENLLKTYAIHAETFDGDLKSLMALTAEVKAINNQAAILHGERIKKVHQILTSYKDGAFTAWLTTTYGNRQTPYNLMQYYEFYEAAPQPVRPQIESMPRQAIYTLASREVDLTQKIDFVQNYQGQTKAELLIKIRELFPLASADKRKENMGGTVVHALEKIERLLQRRTASINPSQKKTIVRLLNHLQELIHE